MIDAALKSLSQMMSPPLRAILWKAVLLALLLIVALALALQRVLVWLAVGGTAWLEVQVGTGWHQTLEWVSWTASIVAGLGVFLGAVFLMPAITALVASVFVDDIAEEVERVHYPGRRGQAVPFGRAAVEGVKTALLAVGVYLLALPFLLFAGFGAIIFFVATAWLLGREYFELAAMRFRSVEEAKALRKDHAGYVFLAGCLIAAFVSIPIVNLATPLFAMALMVHVHQRVG